MNTRIVTLGLSLLGIAGIGVTSWLSIKGHEKAKTVEEGDRKGKVLAFLPAIVSGIGSAACILGSHHISRREIVALTGSCAYLTANRDKILETVKKKYGAEEVKEVQQRALTIPKDAVNHQSIEWTGRGTTKFLDFYSGRLFYSSLEDVWKGIKRLNYEIHSGEYQSYNDLYYYWGLRDTLFGGDFGWPCNEDYLDWNTEEPVSFDVVKVNDADQGEMYIIYLDEFPMESWAEV